MSVNNNESKIFPNRIWEVIILLVLSLIPVGVIMSILIEMSYAQRFIEVAIVFVMAVFVVGVSFLINRIKGKHQSGWSVKDFSFFSHALFLNVIFTALLVFPLFGVIGNSNNGDSSDFLSIFAICLIGPVSEELMFRGVFLRGVLSQYKPQTAILAISLISPLCTGNRYKYCSPSRFLYYIVSSIIKHAICSIQSFCMSSATVLVHYWQLF